VQTAATHTPARPPTLTLCRAAASNNKPQQPPLLRCPAPHCRPPNPSHNHPHRGGLQYGWEKTPDSKKAWISVVVATGMTLISIFAGIPLLRRNVQRDVDAQDAARKCVGGAAPSAPCVCVCMLLWRPCML
jgi:hypothetical protein